MADERRIGKYELIHKIATGGMAEVFLARQTGPEGFEKMLVIKRILPHLANQERFVQMFLDEARLAARFNHPHIAQIFDLGREGDAFYLAMEYVNGEDLRSIVKQCSARKERIPIEHVVRIFIGVLDALHYAHNQLDLEGRPRAVVHRDVSPHNVLVSFEGGVKLVDFGIAKARSEISTTIPGRVKGKHAYMSPEQCQGKELDGRSDIFSAGVVLYELLSWTRLFKRRNDIDTLRAVVACEVKPLKMLRPDLDDELGKIVGRALQPRPEDRFQTAREMQMALEDYLLSRGLKSNSALLSEYMCRLFADKLAVRNQALQQVKGVNLESVVLAKKEAGPDLVAFLDMFFPQSKSADDTRSSGSGPELTPSVESGRQDAVPIVPQEGKRPTPQPAGTKARQSTQEMDLLDGLAPRQPVAAPARESPPLAADYPLPGLADLPNEQAISGEGLPAAAELEAEAAFEASRVQKPKGHGMGGIALVLVLAAGLVLFLVFRSGPPAPRAPATGRIIVKSLPAGADVYFDGRRLPALTPTEVDKVEPGIEHQLEVRYPGLPPWEKSVTLVDTTHPLEIEAVLSEQAARRAQLAGKPIIAGLEANEHGQVEVSSKPNGALVYLDGISTNRHTPTVLAKVAAGQDHVVMVEKAGYRSAFSRFTLEAGGKQQVVLALEKGEDQGSERVAVHVESEPEDARVTVNGFPLSGRTPLAVKLLAGGASELRVEKDGFRSWVRTVRPLEGVDLTFFARLEKK